jgi:uncharacterized protein with PQ loop repeat
MNFITSSLSQLVGPKCSETILSLQFDDLFCYKLFISKGLSLGIVLGAVMVKIPQIVNIISRKSVQGLSLLSNVLETLAIVISLAYNYRLGNPFSTYGEGAFIFVQNIVIMLLITLYNRNTVGSLLVLLGFYVIGYSLRSQDIVSQALLNTLQISTIFIGISSKLPQIWINLKSKSTGQLSIITTFLQFAGTSNEFLFSCSSVNNTPGSG